MPSTSSRSNPPRTRKRVEVETGSLKRAKDGSAFTRCEACNKDVPVVLIDMHSCSLDSKIKMNLGGGKGFEDKKPAPRKKGKSSNEGSMKCKREKKVKDPNMPKRPPTAFFVFMDDFRKTYKEANPDSKKALEVAKEGGEKWKSMPEEEKKPYLEKVAELKAAYEKAMEKYNAPGSEDEQEQEGASAKERVSEKEETSEKEDDE